MVNCPRARVLEVALQPEDWQLWPAPNFFRGMAFEYNQVVGARESAVVFILEVRGPEDDGTMPLMRIRDSISHLLGLATCLLRTSSVKAG